jgi:hypothetical protein
MAQIALNPSPMAQIALNPALNHSRFNSSNLKLALFVWLVAGADLF